MYEGVPQHLSARFFSSLSCLDKATTVQIEHMDDYYKGLSVLWGLVENQYVIVWLNSYELNLELETINEFREQVTSKKPANWSDDDFWNLVAGVHLENSGFTKDKLPKPVKIPLAVGDLMLFDVMTVHAGCCLTL